MTDAALPIELSGGWKILLADELPCGHELPGEYCITGLVTRRAWNVAAQRETAVDAFLRIPLEQEPIRPRPIASARARELVNTFPGDRRNLIRLATALDRCSEAASERTAPTGHIVRKRSSLAQDVTLLLRSRQATVPGGCDIPPRNTVPNDDPILDDVVAVAYRRPPEYTQVASRSAMRQFLENWGPLTPNSWYPKPPDGSLWQASVFDYQFTQPLIIVKEIAQPLNVPRGGTPSSRTRSKLTQWKEREEIYRELDADIPPDSLLRVLALTALERHVTRRCPECGKPNFRAPQARYCTDECGDRARQRKHRGQASSPHVRPNLGGNHRKSWTR